MGRPRKYESDAQRQRACRARFHEQWIIVDRRALELLNDRLERLHEALYRAACRGDLLAAHCHCCSVDSTLDRLAEAFETRGKENASSSTER